MFFPKFNFKKIFIFLFLLSLFLLANTAFGQECKNKDECASKIKEYEQKLTNIREQKNTLSSEIQYADTQIYLTTLKIQSTEVNIKKTESEIENLTEKIEGLDESLNFLGKIFLVKIVEGYKRRESDGLNLYLNVFLNSENASVLTKNIKYIKTTQDSDRRMAFKVQQTKFNFEEQKKLREEKKKQLADLKVFLESQKVVLSSQKAAKQKLLELTKNDERTYQALLEKLRAEYNAIIAIVQGGGSETDAGHVEDGARIASIIPGSSACSTGGHLHFEVTQGGNHQNPANYLSGKGVAWDLCSWYGCDSAFSFGGSWPWPINDPITITQPFGVTAFARGSGRYPMHTGIDMTSSDGTVKAVQKGKLYRGSYGCGGGSLNYVKVTHDDGGLVTYYLHVNY